MATIDLDFSVAANGDIRYVGDVHGGADPGYFTVIELHRFLQDLADDAVASGDDLLDITDQTPSDRSTDNIVALINGYNIDDVAAEHLYDGSILQAGGATVYSGLVVVGAVPAGTNLQIVQNNTLLTNYWGTGLNADAGANILLRVMIKTRDGGANIDGQRLRVQARELGDTYAEFSLSAGLGNATAAIFTSLDLNNQTAAGTISGWASIVNIEGLNLIDVTGDLVDEEYYSQWDLGTQSINDLYERTKWIQRRSTVQTIHGMNGELFRGVTHSFAYDGEAGVSPATNDVYAWGLKVTYSGLTGSFTVGEAVLFGTSNAVARVLSVDATDLSLVVAVESGVPASTNSITGVASGATATVSGAPVGQATGGGAATILAVDDAGVTGNMYVQLIKGTIAADNAILYKTSAHTATATVAGSPVSRSVSPAFIGQSTGSAIIGAYGIGIQAADLTASDLLFDLTNTPRTPPNNVTFTVNGLVSGEDRVLVGPEAGGVLEVTQLGLNATLNTDSVATIVVDAAIPLDTPISGTIRVFDDNGIARRIVYSSYTGSTFTIDNVASGTNNDFLTVNATIANDVFISYIDELAGGASASFTGVYQTNRSLFIRVRDGGGTPIRTFETTGTLGSAGGTTTAIRTSDA